jgi:hypothetical protein
VAMPHSLGGYELINNISGFIFLMIFLDLNKGSEPLQFPE